MSYQIQADTVFALFDGWAMVSEHWEMHQFTLCAGWSTDLSLSHLGYYIFSIKGIYTWNALIEQAWLTWSAMQHDAARYMQRESHPLSSMRNLRWVAQLECEVLAEHCQGHLDLHDGQPLH